MTSATRALSVAVEAMGFSQNVGMPLATEARVSSAWAGVAAANRVLRHYRMSLADWQGNAFVLSGATGKTEIVDNLAHLWAAAERLLGGGAPPR